MELEIKKISGVGEFFEEEMKEGRKFVAGEAKKAFLVVRKNTIEVRTDGRLGEKLKSEYESVMESRYFGRGGIEIVMSGQMSREEIEDLVRLSYNLTIADKN